MEYFARSAKIFSRLLFSISQKHGTNRKLQRVAWTLSFYVLHWFLHTVLTTLQNIVDQINRLTLDELLSNDRRG